MAAHRKGQTMMSILSKVRLSAALEHGWGVHVPKLGSESCCESHCGWFCISLPTSGRTDMNPPDTDGIVTPQPWPMPPLYIYSGHVSIGTSKALYEGYSKGSGHLSFDGFELWLKPAMLKEFFYVRSV